MVGTPGKELFEAFEEEVLGGAQFRDDYLWRTGWGVSGAIKG